MTKRQHWSSTFYVKVLLFVIYSSSPNTSEAVPFGDSSGSHTSSDKFAWLPWQSGAVVRPPFASIIDLFQQKSESIVRIIREFINDVSPETVPRVSQEVLSAMDELQDLGNKRQHDTFAAVDCLTCQTLIRSFKALLRNYNYSQLELPAILICYQLFDNIQNEQRRQELCNGSVTTQGPHVVDIVKASTPEKICKFQNLCFQTKTTNRQKPTLRRPPDQYKKSKQMNADNEGKRIDQLIKVAQITDIHIDVRYLPGTDADCGLPICCTDIYGSGNSGPFGDYKCNIPPRTVEEFMKKIAAINPDVVLYSGDVSGSRVWDESFDEVLNCSTTLTSAIAGNIGDRRVYPNFGNHEMYPTNLYYKGLPDIERITQNMTALWSPIASFTDEQRETMNNAGYYAAVVKPGLRLISYNSNYMYTSNFYNVLNYDLRNEARDMMNFVELELKKARDLNEKVILMGHHPTNSGDYLIDFAYWYRQLVLNYSDIVVLQIAGHRHCDFFNLIADDDNNVQSIVYLAPPVTTGGTKNPSVRIYLLDPVTFEIVDYDQYYLDFKSVANDATELESKIVLLYSAKKEYNMADLSPTSWERLVDRMETDSNVLLRHVRHYYVDARGNINCDANCQRQHVCGLRNSAYDAYYYCINDNQPYSTESWPFSNGTSPFQSNSSESWPSAPTTRSSDESISGVTRHFATAMLIIIQLMVINTFNMMNGFFC